MFAMPSSKMNGHWHNRNIDILLNGDVFTGVFTKYPIMR